MKHVEQKEAETELDRLCRYCAKKKDIVFFLFFLVLAVYGAWVFKDFVTFDAEGFYSLEHGSTWYGHWLARGRWGFYYLKKLLGVTLINPFFSATVFLFCFPFSAVLWCYLLDEWDQGVFASDWGKILFGILYLTHPVWATQFAYRNQMEVISVTLVLMPATMIFFTRWLKHDKICTTGGWIALAGTVFCFAGYQSFVLIYLEALAVYYFCLVQGIPKSEEKEGRREFYRRLIRGAVFSILAYLIYSGLSALIRKIYGYNNLAAAFAKENFLWTIYGFRSSLKSLIHYLLQAFLGDGQVYTCVLGVECLLLFVLLVRYWRQKRSLRGWYTLIVCGLLAVPFVTTLLMAGTAVNRQQLALVFAIAVLGWYELDACRRRMARTWRRSVMQTVLAGVVLTASVAQIQMNTRLLYTDYKVLEQDYRMMEQIYEQALQKGAEEGDTIVFVGVYPNTPDETLVENEVVGFSYFEVTEIDPKKAAQAMQAYGFRVMTPDFPDYDRAAKLAEEMDCWPSGDSIVVEDGLIVVRLS